MATVTGFTAARMLEIENATIVDASIIDGELILERHDAGTVNVGSVVGPEGPPGGNADVGDIKASIRTSLTGWLLMGTSVPNADATYPALWGYAPASWKSGTTLNLPSMTDRVLQGAGALGSITGANTKVLVGENLPPHVHTMGAHTHSLPAHTHPMGAHTHSINHDHGAITTGTQSANHTHTFSASTSSAGTHSHTVTARLDPISGSLGELGVSNAGGSMTTKPTSSAGAHTHTVSGTTAGNNVSHTHSVNLPAFVGTSGAASASTTGAGGSGTTGTAVASDSGPGPGTSTPINVEQAALRVNFFIKH